MDKNNINLFYWFIHLRQRNKNTDLNLFLLYFISFS
jgi:hypothetical protein